MTDAAPAALDIAGLSHAFGARQVLREVAFSVRPGDFKLKRDQTVAEGAKDILLASAH